MNYNDPALLDKLSDDAKCVAAAWFPAATTVAFAMKNNRPSARARKALNELVKANYLSLLAGEAGEYVYKSSSRLAECRIWFMANKDNPALDFELLEPVPVEPELTDAA